MTEGRVRCYQENEESQRHTGSTAGEGTFATGCLPVPSVTGGTQGGEQLQQDRCPRDGFSECLLGTPPSLEKKGQENVSTAVLSSRTYGLVGCPVPSVLLKEVPEGAHAWCSPFLGTHLLFGPFGKGHGGDSSTGAFQREGNRGKAAPGNGSDCSESHPHLGVSPPHRAATGSSWDHRGVERETEAPAPFPPNPHPNISLQACPHFTPSPQGCPLLFLSPHILHLCCFQHFFAADPTGCSPSSQ